MKTATKKKIGKPRKKPDPRLDERYEPAGRLRAEILEARALLQRAVVAGGLDGMALMVVCGQLGVMSWMLRLNDGEPVDRLLDHLRQLFAGGGS
jgi:hypothetical protein